MQHHTRPRRDFKAMEQRRMKAARMFAAGKAQADVARALGVSRQSASRWHTEWQRSGKDGLKGAKRAGRLPRLNDQQLEEVERALRQGARLHGFGTDLWTLSRLTDVIKRLTGIRYHPGHVWKLMRKMGWSLQRPAKRAKERNDKAVREWKEKRWPVLKKTPVAERPGLSSKTRAE
jgi:transposase